MSLNWNNVKPACCAKWLVLPTVYSDALSYGEQLDKFCYQLNQLIENNNILPDFIAEMIKEYINSGAIGEVVRDILANYILNVKYPPNGITPAVGDGSADDTEAIQGCIDYAAENGGVVYFPYGSYLTQPLTMKDGVSLFGFDRYSTKIVLKGGATKPLIGGSVSDLSIANLTLDGNSGIQVNEVNVVTIIGTNVLLTNLIIKDGYTLVNYAGNGGNFQISDVVFGNAVKECLFTSGNADIQCENVLFNHLSAVGGICVMDIGTDGGFFNVKSVATCNQCIVVTGNNNKISAIVENAAIPVVDNGLQNNIEIFGVSNKEFYSGDTTKNVNGNYYKRVGGAYTKAVDGNATESVDGNFSSIVKGVVTETFNNTRTVNENNKAVNNAGTLNETIDGVVGRNYNNNFNENTAGNKTEKIIGNSEEGISGSKTITTDGEIGLKGKDVIIDTENPLTYKTPVALTDDFSYIPAKDLNGEQYKILTTKSDSLSLGNVSATEVSTGGIESIIYFYAGSLAYVLKFKPTSVKILPTNGNVSGDPHKNQLPIGKYALTRNETIISNSGYEGASVFNGTYNERRDADVAFYAGFTTTDIKVLKALNGEKDQAAITALGNNVDPVASPLVQNHVKYDYTEIVNSTNEAIKNHFNEILKASPRKIIAVDDDGYFYVISVAGRTLMNKGWTYDECINFCSAQNYKTAVQMDGGGSVQTVVDKVSVIDNFSMSTPGGRDVLTAILWEVNL